MPEKAAKKIQRRNERRDRGVKLNAEAKEYSLGVNQIESFLVMSETDLREARRQACHELAMLCGFPASDGKTRKEQEMNNRVRYIDDVLRRRRG